MLRTRSIPSISRHWTASCVLARVHSGLRPVFRTYSSTETQISKEKRERYERFFKPKSRKQLASIFGAVALVVAIGGYLIWPHHTFTSEVAKKLRSGLYKEKDGEFEAALHLYLEALAVAQSQDLDQLSDEYTGIQYKIAEMHEKLGNGPQALKVYDNVMGKFYKQLAKALDTPRDSFENYDDHVNKLVCKDLQLLSKYISLPVESPGFRFLAVETHMLLINKLLLARFESRCGTKDINGVTTNDTIFWQDAIKESLPPTMSMLLFANIEIMQKISHCIDTIIRETRGNNKIGWLLTQNDKYAADLPEIKQIWGPIAADYFNLFQLVFDTVPEGPVPLNVINYSLLGIVSKLSLTAGCDYLSYLQLLWRHCNCTFSVAEYFGFRKGKLLASASSSADLEKFSDNQEKFLVEAKSRVFFLQRKVQEYVAKFGSNNDTVTLYGYALNLLGFIEMKTGNLDDAEKFFHEAISVFEKYQKEPDNPKDLGTVFAIAECERDLEEVEKLRESKQASSS